MYLRDYIKKLPRGKRAAFRQQLAQKHDCSVSLVRKWESWPPDPEWSEDQCRAMARKHPADLEAIRLTEALTDHAVTRRDLRPEVFHDDE